MRTIYKLSIIGITLAAGWIFGAIVLAMAGNIKLSWPIALCVTLGLIIFGYILSVIGLKRRL